MAPPAQSGIQCTCFTGTKESGLLALLVQSDIQCTCFTGTKESGLLALLVQNYLASHAKAPTGAVRLAVEASLSLLALLVQKYRY
jgi:hypothetical protein